MNADEAKKQALLNKKLAEESRKTRAHNAEALDIKLLRQHFDDKISQAVVKGLLSTPPMEFDADRFSDKVIQLVRDELDEDGFNLIKTHHNAYNKTIFTISWS